MTRPLFGREGALSKQQIYEMIDAAKRGAVFHKLVSVKDFAVYRACRRIHEEVIQTSYLSLRLLFSLGLDPDVHSDSDSLLGQVH